MSCFYSFCLCDSCDIAHTVFNACILLNSYVPFTRTMIDFTETSSLKIFQPLIETLWGTPRPKDILGILFVEVRLSFTISGTFELTKLILAVVCAPVAQRGELWEVSVASGPCAGTQLLLSFAHRKRWWYWCCGCWDFPLASTALASPLSCLEHLPARAVPVLPGLPWWVFVWCVVTNWFFSF